MTYPMTTQTKLFTLLTRRMVLLVALAASALLPFGAWGASSAHAAFGFVTGASGFDGSFTNRDGSPDTRAGSHPYDLTIGFQLNKVFENGKPAPDGAPKDIHVDLPAGFIGNPNATTKCTPEELAHSNFPSSLAVTCPASSQVGVAVVDLTKREGIAPTYASVFNMVTPAGIPAVFGFSISNVNVYIDTAIRTGSDYGVSSILNNAPGALPTAWQYGHVVGCAG